MRMKMRNAELYLKGATVIYGFSKIARTNVKLEKTKLLTSLKAFILLITCDSSELHRTSLLRTIFASRARVH